MDQLLRLGGRVLVVMVGIIVVGLVGEVILLDLNRMIILFLIEGVRVSFGIACHCHALEVWKALRKEREGQRFERVNVFICHDVSMCVVGAHALSNADMATRLGMSSTWHDPLLARIVHPHGCGCDPWGS